MTYVNYVYYVAQMTVIDYVSYVAQIADVDYVACVAQMIDYDTQKTNIDYVLDGHVTNES